MYQATDPIYYLANYLLHYRHCEINNIQKSKDLEELLYERNKYTNKKEETVSKQIDEIRLFSNSNFLLYFQIDGI